MKIVDINLFIYALNKDTPHHSKAKTWLEDALSSEEPFGFAWIVILGFLRIVTNAGIMPNPLRPELAVEIVDDWLKQPPSLTVVPSDQHWLIFKELRSPLGTAANLTSDAHLAVLTIEHGPAFILQTMISVASNHCDGPILWNDGSPAGSYSRSFQVSTSGLGTTGQCDKSYCSIHLKTSKLKTTRNKVLDHRLSLEVYC